MHRWGAILKKSYKRPSKRKIRIAFVLSLIVILAISTIGFLLFYKPDSANSNDTPPPNNTPDSTPNNETPTPSPSRPNITLNKQIPPGYIMGFPVDAGLMTGMDVLFIQNSNEKVSIRFTAKVSGTVTKLVIHAFAYRGQPTIRAGLQEDDSGDPNGNWIEENAFSTVQLESKSGFKTFQLGTQVFLTKGQVYHIVIEAAEDPLNGTAGIRTYKGDGFAQPSNPEDPDIVWNDPQMTVLSSSGSSWNPENKWPVFIVGYSDGNLEGQPYSLCAQWVVWGSTYVGQSLVPASDYKVGKIAFVVSLGSGNPQDKLYYQIRDASNVVLAEGVFVDPSQLTVSQTWIEATLATPVTLKAGKLYRIVLLSPQTDLANAYYLFGHEFCYDPSIGYGSLQHQLTSTLSGGEFWGDNKDADAIFKVTTSE